MMCSLICLGFVLNNQGKIIGVRLCDLEKRETSLVKIESFKDGLANGIEILNIELKDGKYDFYGGNRNYSIYNQDGSIRQYGETLLYKKDDNEWVTILQDGKVINTYDWIRNMYKNSTESEINKLYINITNGLLIDTMIIPNKKDNGNEQIDKRSDLDMLKSFIDRDYTKELIKHIDIGVDLKGLNNQIRFHSILLKIEESYFTGYMSEEISKKIPRFCNFGIKTVLGTVIGENDDIILHSKSLLLLSDEIYTSGTDFEFKAINYDGYTKYIKFKLSDIIYVRDTSKWCGNTEIIKNKLRSSFITSSEDDNANIELVIYNKETKEFIVVTSCKVIFIGNRNYALNIDYHSIELDKDNNFIKDIDVLYTLLSPMIYRSDVCINKNRLLDGIAYLDENDRYNITNNLESLKLSEIDKLNKDLYSEMKIGTKDNINVYSCDGSKLLIIYNGLRDSIIRTVYKSEENEYNILYYRHTCSKGKDSNRIYNFSEAYSRLSRYELKNLLTVLEKNKAYKDLPIGTKGYRGYVSRNTKYTLIYKESLIRMHYQGKHRIVMIDFKGTHRDVSDVQSLYSGIDEASSVVYFVYRAVLKYVSTIPKCKEQLMYNGEIEDLLDDLVIEEVVDKRRDLVTVYVGQYKIEMKLSIAVKQLLGIYENANNEKTIAFKKKLDIMKIAGNINSVNGKIILDGSLNERDVIIPKDVSGVIIKGEKDVVLNKLVLTTNISFNNDECCSNIRVNDLDVSGSANSMVQKFGKNNSILRYKHCKIHKLSITGKGLYELILTVFWVNDKVSKGVHANLNGILSRSKEVIIISLNQNYDEVEKTLSSIHKIYELEFNEKSLKSLLEYIESLKDIEKMKKVTKSDNYRDIGRYIMMIAYLLSSYKFDKVYYDRIMNIGTEICEGDLYM